MSWDLFDSIAGPLDILDRIESWVTFAIAPVSKRGKHGQLDVIQYSIPRADKCMERGLPTINLNETLAYLHRFGIISKCNGFDSQNMYFQVRRNQQKWTDFLLNVDANDIPQLDYSRKSWTQQAKERKAEKRSQRQSASWLDKLLG